MFQALIHRAQAGVDKAIAQVANRAIIAIPFLIALGFATSAAYLRLDREFGAEMATLMMAGSFAFIGLLAGAILRTSSSAPVLGTAETREAAESGNTAQSEEPAFAAADKELMTALLASAAPIVLPSILRGLLRNLPLVAVILAAIFVLMSSGGTATGEQPQEPSNG